MHLSCLLLLTCPGAPSPQPALPVAAAQTELRLDPRLLAQAAEVWAVASGAENPIWPGWDVSETPLLFYYPGEQEILINHPDPPEGFAAYAGPLSFPGWEIAVRDGETLFDAHGQNTSTTVNGVRTLVVADTLSNLRSNVFFWSQGDGTAAERDEALNLPMLAADPYDQLGLILHEAFHVEQDRWGLNKHGDENALASYPSLSVENNVGFALEADALAEALTATEEEELWLAALRWLAVRTERRAGLSATDVAYEDGTEFNEGLAKYTEWRLTYALEGREPAPAMAWVRGFRGYGDLSFQREELVRSMRGFLTGESVVNNDRYGAAPVRFRLYWSGMAIGGMLDAILPEWKERMMEPETTLTNLVEEALLPSRDDILAAWEEARSATGYEELVAEKSRLREDGLRARREMLDGILYGAGTLVTVDYGRVTAAGVGFQFTPFGIVRVDESRTIYTQSPVGASFGPANVVRQTRAIPLLHDAGARQVRFRLDEEVTAEGLAAALGVTKIPGEPLAEASLALPGANVNVRDAVFRLNPGEIVIELH